MADILTKAVAGPKLKEQLVANGVDAVVHVGGQVKLGRALLNCRCWLVEQWQARAANREACGVRALDSTIV